MKRIKPFTESLLSARQKPSRLIGVAIALLFMLITLSGSANAQSRDRDNPTRITSNVISGELSANNTGENYHYSFVAGPGEVKITLSVQSGGSVNQVMYDLFDEDAEKLGGKFVTSSLGKTEQAVERINIKRRQLVLLRVISSASFGPGKYRIQLDGAVDFSQNTPSSGAVSAATEAARRVLAGDDTDNPECLPKKGILRVKMKDGSIRRIDLSQAVEITIEP